MDHHARPDRAAAEKAQAGFRAARRQRAAEETSRAWSIDFRTDPDCKLFLTTNAGSTGLNLQAANTVINVDLPWNPAVLEQRIARAHRMGQRNRCRCSCWLPSRRSRRTCWRRSLPRRTWPWRHSTPNRKSNTVDLVSGMQELKNRLEVLLGARPEAPRDESVDHSSTADAEKLDVARRDRVAAAGGELLGAAFKFLGELVARQPAQQPPESLVAQLRGGLDACVDSDPHENRV